MQPTRWHHRRPHTPLALSHLLPVLVLVRGWLLSTLITTYGAFYRIDAIEETVTWTTSDKARYVNGTTLDYMGVNVSTVIRLKELYRLRYLLR
jgi:hypothetical protein